jgi:hypothetical protein
MNTINNGIPFVPENTIDPAAGLNISLNTIDALLQVLVVSVGANTPPGSPANGARYIVGTSPTGAWAGQANKLARWLDGAWQFTDARYALNAADGLFYVRAASTWTSAPLPANVQALAGLTGAADRVPYFTGEGAMALAVLTAQARTFLAAVDAAGQRSAMGLGTAALATLQTSTDDATAGRVLTVGAGGLLTLIPPSYPLSDFEASPAGVPTGLYGFNGTASAPFGWAAGWVRVERFGSTRVTLEVCRDLDQRKATRSFSGASWRGAWREFSFTDTDRVLDAFTVSTLPAAAANTRRQVYVSNLAGQAAPVFSDGTNWRRVSDNSIAN